MSKYATNLDAAARSAGRRAAAARSRATRDELFRLQLGQYTNQVTSTAALTTKRRDIARILTILNGRKRGIETQAQKSAAPAPSAEAAPAEEDDEEAKAKS